MAIQVSKRRFNVLEYERMGEAGILDEDSNVELIEGVVIDMHPPDMQPPREHRFTVEEYNALIEAGILREDDHVELIEGEIIEMSPVGKRRVACVNRLTALFGRYAGQSALLSVQNPIELPNYAQPQPDIALLKPRDDFYAGNLPRPADVLLLVEVADTSREFDRGVKLSLYARAGIPEMWLVDRPNETVEVNTQPAGEAYQASRQARRGESIDVGRLPGLSLGVEAILGQEEK